MDTKSNKAGGGGGGGGGGGATSEERRLERQLTSERNIRRTFSREDGTVSREELLNILLPYLGIVDQVPEDANKLNTDELIILYAWFRRMDEYLHDIHIHKPTVVDAWRWRQTHQDQLTQHILNVMDLIKKHQETQMDFDSDYDSN